MSKRYEVAVEAKRKLIVYAADEEQARNRARAALRAEGWVTTLLSATEMPPVESEARGPEVDNLVPGAAPAKTESA